MTSPIALSAMTARRLSTLPLPNSVAGTGRAMRTISARTISSVDRPRQPDRLVEPGINRSARPSSAGDRGRLRCRMNDERAAGRREGGQIAAVQSSSGSLPPSNSWIGCAGMTVEIACL